MFRFALLACAIALASPAAAFPRVYFFCMTADQSAPAIRVGPMAPNQAEARFLYPPDHDEPQRDATTLWVGMSDAGEGRFDARGLSLILSADTPALQLDQALVPCEQLDLPQDHPRGDFPALARSIGGVVRAAPGDDHPVLDDIAADSALYLVSRTEHLSFGFPWFELYNPVGPAGFVWGGEICPGFEPVEGVLPACAP